MVEYEHPPSRYNKHRSNTYDDEGIIFRLIWYRRVNTQFSRPVLDGLKIQKLRDNQSLTLIDY